MCVLEVIKVVVIREVLFDCNYMRMVEVVNYWLVKYFFNIWFFWCVCRLINMMVLWDMWSNDVEYGEIF